VTKGVPLARSKQIRVIVADDHPIVREGLAALVKSQPDMQLLGEAENGRAAVQQYLRHRPDVILLDLRMPEMDGIAATRAILERAPRAKIIVLSTYRGDEDVYQALRAGAKAYLLKDSSRKELLNSIRSVHEGEVKISPPVSAQLVASLVRARLTKREAEIMRQLVAGKSNKEIGSSLQVTEGTVKVHVGHILKKLGASGRTEAIRIALERGVVHLSPM
jgi:two-component system, NarL family, response regulator